MLHSPTQEMADLRLGTEAYAEQVSRDFEELTWLRCLSEQLEACDAASPLGQVAEGVLSELRSMIGAAAVVLVGSDQGAASGGTVQNGKLRIVCTTGSQLVDDAACRELIGMMAAETCDCPLIRNHIPRGCLPEGCSELQSYVAVPVARQDVKYGWLLAFNRQPRSAVFFSGDGKGALLPGQDEFGTEEASLLHAAARALASHARNAQLFREKELLLIGVMRTLINAIDAKDAYTWGHSDRVALMAKRLGEQLQLSYLECERLYTTGLLHDIGKIGIPDRILQKAGPLTADEFDEIKKHPEIGFAILQHLHQLNYVLPGVLHHHESVDGTGYPYGLKGDEIPLFGRILAVVDTYDAMTSSRPYRKAMPHEVARSKLIAGAGQQWDARIVAAFMDCAADAQSICGAARSEALHGPNGERVIGQGANGQGVNGQGAVGPGANGHQTGASPAPAADQAFAACDALQSAMMALNHLSVP